jgi:hypothetical protein
MSLFVSVFSFTKLQFTFLKFKIILIFSPKVSKFELVSLKFGVMRGRRKWRERNMKMKVKMGRGELLEQGKGACVVQERGGGYVSFLLIKLCN